MTPIELLNTIELKEIDSKISGIYMIYCISNGKCYIGRGKSIHKRWCAHKYQLKRNTHLNPHLQNCYNLYSKNSLLYFILENTENRAIREAYWVSQIDYNLLLNIGPIANEFPMSKETKDKISSKKLGKKMSEETKLKISEAFKRIWSDESYRRKFSNSQKSKKMPKATEESRKNMSEAQKKWHRENLVSDKTKKKKSEMMKLYASIPKNKEQLLKNLNNKKLEGHIGFPI